MKIDFDEFGIQDTINFMNINNQMKKQQLKSNINPSMGFNDDSIYNSVENK